MSRIVILGGGSAGWLVAAYLAARLRGVSLTLVEASDIPTIGVGEATTPSLRATVAEIGLAEQGFMRACEATFKHGIWFKQWSAPPGEDPDASYFHPFERPLRSAPEGVSDVWARGGDPHQRAFCDAVCIQAALAKEGLGPKRIEDPPFTGPMPYAYHLDAGRFADVLKAAALQRGVRHLAGLVAAVEALPDGRVQALLLADGRRCEGELFVDCSGFRARLLEEHCQSRFEDCSAILFCDRAVVCQVPHLSGAAIAPYTVATAQEAGWIWDIGLTTRRGVGHVFSSRHSAPDRAEAVLRAHLGPAAADLPARHLAFRVGYRPQSWVGNCVAVGLAQGFVEPLESTGILMIEQSAWALAALAPRYLAGASPQPQFNRLIQRHYEQIIDFVKFHYVLSRRKDSAFWRDNVDPRSWTPWLLEKFEHWRSGAPDIYDFENLHSIFDQASYQYVALGMGWRPTAPAVAYFARDTAAVQVFERVWQALDKARQVLPPHMALLAGLQAEAPASAEPARPRFSTSTLAIPYNYAS